MIPVLDMFEPGDICYGRNSMGDLVSLSICDLSALFHPEAPVKCSSPILSVSSVHRDECRATFASPCPPHMAPSPPLFLISAHYTPLARCQPVVPEYSADLLRSLQADDMAALPSSWPIWVAVSFIAVSVALQMGRLLWHIEFFFL